MPTPGAAQADGETVTKKSYTIPCSSTFRDAVAAAARRRRVNVADMARSILLSLSAEDVAAFPDPGGPGPDDRDTVVIKSGPARGRPWRRKPRLQVRMAPGYAVATIRRALGLALALAGGDLRLRLDDAAASPAADGAGDEVERLRAMVGVLSFDPLQGGVRTRAEALYVLGFPPEADPGQRVLRARFRMLATIHHPDGAFGSHGRMSQLNAAMEMLRAD